MSSGTARDEPAGAGWSWEAVQPARASTIARLAATLRVLAWLGATLVLLVAGVIHWSGTRSADLAGAQMACSMGAALLALLATAYTVRGRRRSAAFVLVLSAAAAGGWVALLFV
ncbi:MAG: hypothetical protein ACJ76V_08960 [Thermoleophilaceae bacterium]